MPCLVFQTPDCIAGSWLSRAERVDVPRVGSVEAVVGIGYPLSPMRKPLWIYLMSLITADLSEWTPLAKLCHSF